MAGASNGLQKALTRAGASVVAIAEMTADDLIAQMTDEQRAAMAATLAPKAGADATAGGAPAKPAKEGEGEQGEDGADGEASDAGDKPNKNKGSEASAAAIAKARAEGFRAGSARAAEVIGHDSFSAAAAVKLLGNAKLDAMSADEIGELMGEQPDAGAREMLGALRGDKTPPLGSGGNADDGKGKADVAAGWGKATAKMAQRFGFKS